MAATIDIIGVGGYSSNVVIESASVRRFELMKEDYIRIVFFSDKMINIRLGDSITHEQWGTFYITEAQKPTYNRETGGYDYDLQFNAPYYRWNNKLYKFAPNTNRNEASWSLTDNLKNHMAVFLRNLEHYGWIYTVDAGSYELEEAERTVFIQFDNIYILDALTKIAEAFNLEWWITDNIIHLGRVESGTAIDFEVGVNVENMEAQSSEKDSVTRFYAFGSSQNVPSGYRKNGKQVLLNGVVQKRIMLPADTPYIDIEDGLASDEIVEGIVIFDEVYPRTKSKISEVIEVEKTVEKNNSTAEATTDTNATPVTDEETEKVKIYRFKTEDFTFSEKYILAGQTLQVKFESGKLNGMTFDLAFNPEGKSEKIIVKDGEGTKEIDNPEAQLFEIVRNDMYGLMLPNETLKPSAEDDFILLGWDANKMEAWKELVSRAEQELKTKAKAFAEKKKIDPLTYSCTMMADYMYGLNNGQQDPNYSKVGTFPLGQRIRLNNAVYFKGGSRVSRVVGFEYKLDIPYDGAVIIVGESATYSSSRATEAAINAATDSINYRGGEFSQAGGGRNVYIITSNDATAPSESNVYSAKRADWMYLRKNIDDVAQGMITFLSGLKIGNGGYGIDRDGRGRLLELVLDELRTRGYTGDDLLTDKGFRAWRDEEGRGHIITDYLDARVKAVFAALEVRKAYFTGGNLFVSGAGAKIAVVKAIDKNDVVWDVVRNSDGTITLRRTIQQLPTVGGKVIGVGSVLRHTQTEEVIYDPREEYQNTVIAWRCYWLASDGERAVENEWQVGDQALCETFRLRDDYDEGVGNKRYWRLVVRKGAEALDDGRLYNYVDLANFGNLYNGLCHGVVGCHWVMASDTLLPKYNPLDPEQELHYFGAEGLYYSGGSGWGGYKSGSSGAPAPDLPEAGDEIVHCGSQTDTSRQGMVQIAAVGNEPQIGIYAGITGYGALVKWRKLLASPSQVLIEAEFLKIITGGSEESAETYFRGQKGDKGDPGEKGEKGDKGNDGTSFSTKGSVIGVMTDVDLDAFDPQTAESSPSNPYYDFWDKFRYYYHADHEDFIVPMLETTDREGYLVVACRINAYRGTMEPVIFDGGWDALHEDGFAAGDAYIVRRYTDDGLANYLDNSLDGHLFVLNENAEWLDLGKITGASGRDGKDGKDGKDGEDGAAGANGKDGEDGLAVRLAPETLVVEEVETGSSHSSVDLSNAKIAVSVLLGMTAVESVQGQDTTTARGLFFRIGTPSARVTEQTSSGSASISVGVNMDEPLVHVNSLSSNVRRGAIAIPVGLELWSGAAGTSAVVTEVGSLTATADLYVNRLGSLLIQAKNDTYERMAAKVFTDGHGTEYSLLSVVRQTSGKYTVYVKNRNDGVTSVFELDSDGNVLVQGEKITLSNGSGREAVFENGKLRLSLLDVAQIVAQGIATQSLTANALHVTGSSIFDGVLDAKRGKIAGFNISGDGLTNGPEYTNDAYIIFRNDAHKCFAGIGGNVLPASTVQRAVARFENEDNNDQWSLGANYAMILSAKNHSRKNVALQINYGQTRGLRPEVRGVNNNTTLTDDDYTIIATNGCTLTLPSSPQEGQQYHIVCMTTGTVRIQSAAQMNWKYLYNSSPSEDWRLGKGTVYDLTASVREAWLTFTGTEWHLTHH